MNEKSPNSIKPSIQKLLDSYKPRPISEVALKPRRAYSTHPRVQKAFRRMLNHMKEREQRNATQSSPDTPLVSNPLAPEEIEALRHDLKTSAAQAQQSLRTANPLTPEEVATLRRNKKAAIEYMRKALQGKEPPQTK
jgi:hypothetical protein